MKNNIPFLSLKQLNQPFEQEFKKAYELFIESGWYILGQNVDKFEQDFSEYIGVEHGVGVANGLDALLLSLQALSFEIGDEVIVPSNTYIATIIAIIQASNFKAIICILFKIKLKSIA